MAYGLGETTYSVEAESAAFKQLHSLNVAINQLKAQGLDYSSLLPYYKAALDKYKAVGASDPANLTAAEQFYLDAVDGLKQVGQFADVVSNKLLIGGAIILGILYFWKKR